MKAKALAHKIRKAAAVAGKRYYETGIPCKYGHVAKRVVSYGKCIECIKVKNGSSPKSS